MTTLLHLEGVYLSVAGRHLYTIDHLTVESGDKVGIIGKNGSGKTSLLRLITGDLQADKGRVQVEAHFSYFQQYAPEDLDFNDSLNYQLLSEMGVPWVDPASMSGGEDQKLRLSQFISSQQAPLILDEPTNYLDAASTELLANQLAHYRNALLIVSHNRDFLQRVVNKIWAIKGGQVREYIGSYQDFLQQQEVQNLTQARDHARYIQERDQILTAMDHKKNQAQQMANVRASQKQRRIHPGRLAASKDKQSGQKGIERGIKHLQHRLEKLQVVEAKDHDDPICFPLENFYQLHTKIPIMAHDFRLAKGDKVLIERASFQFAHDDKVAITGPNGSGKTSLLNCLSQGREDLFISSKARMASYVQAKGIQARPGTTPLAYLGQHSEYPMDFIEDLLKNLGLHPHSFDQGVEALSGGEQTRVSLAKTFLSPSNILLLDEPTNFLDLPTLEALEALIQAYPGLVIFTSHDRSFVEGAASKVYTIQGRKLVQVK